MATKSRDTKTKQMAKHNFRRLFYNNFGAGDFMITLTFAKETCKQQSQRDLGNFVKRVRRLYRRNGAKLKYLYVYNGKSGGTHPHYYIVFNSVPGLLIDDIVKLWDVEYTNAQVIFPDNNGLCIAMCEYLVKGIQSGSSICYGQTERGLRKAV